MKQGLKLKLIACVLSVLSISSSRYSRPVHSHCGASSQLQQHARDPRYPTHWWAAVPTEGKPEWEILPQEAGPGEVILSKRNELGLLSNFAPTPFTLRGRRYASLEGFWQMMLYPEGPNDPRAKFPGLQWKYTRAQVAQMTAFEAKAAGTLAEENMQRMGITWVTFEGKRLEYRSAVPGRHHELIISATWAKVRQNPSVKKVLLATGNLILKPDHHEEPNAPPEWRYFEILTQIRAKLQRKGQLDPVTETPRRKTLHRESEIPPCGSGWIVQDWPTKKDALLNEYHPREWVDCSDPAFFQRRSERGGI